MKTSKFNFYFGLFVLTSLFGLTSCEDVDTFEPYDKPATFNFSRPESKLALQDLKDKSLSFQVYSNFGGTFIFPDSSMITFYPQSFLLNGVPVTNKIIEIEIDLVRRKSDMVEQLLATSSGNKIIESGGMVNVRAFCDGKELTVDPQIGYNLKIAVPNGNIPVEMELFYGEETVNGINWVEADGDPSVQNNVFQSEWTLDSTGRFVIGMECFPKKFGWVNCDYFSKFNNVPLTQPCLIVNGPANGDSVFLHAIAVFKKEMIIIQPCCNQQVDEICFGPLPIGEPVYYIVIGKGNKGYYLGYVEKNIETDDKVVIRIDLKTLQEIKDFLANL
ncbi:MAG: hypothetical protein IPM92_02340 [Saprospiraceae bacterium]|nr:hypothetical protein [Saprospiraceae bacterium]